MRVEIYQIKMDIEERHNIAYMNYSYITKQIKNLKKDFLQYYEKKYEYIEQNANYNTDNEILESIYYKFNMERPDDFKGHSLSTSDIVILDDRMYFCDSFGWQEM